MGFNAQVYRCEFKTNLQYRKVPVHWKHKKGWCSMICNGYTEANNKVLKSYEAGKPISYIIYLNVNNLYGHSMMQLTRTEMLVWVNPKDFNLDSYFNLDSLFHFILIFLMNCMN